MATKIRLLQERSRQEDTTAQIKELRKEQVETLTKLVEARESRFILGTMQREVIIDADSALVNARLEATDKSEERITLLTAALKESG